MFIVYYSVSESLHQGTM